MTAIECRDLGVRYKRAWALEDCSLSIPEGRIVGLVGPNGAGKSTLMHCIVGLLTPTSGEVSVLDGLRAGSEEALSRVAFVAQDSPLYRHLSVAATVELSLTLNHGQLDTQMLKSRIQDLRIPLTKRVGELSGGQAAQLALSIALARHPRLLVLDEPLARLDPLARHTFMSTLLSAVADGDLSVLFSSHVVSELERSSDFIVLVAGGRVRLVGDIEMVLKEHCLLRGPSSEIEQLAAAVKPIQVRTAGRNAQMIVREPLTPLHWERETISLEEVILAYLEQSETDIRLPLDGELNVGAMSR